MALHTHFSMRTMPLPRIAYIDAVRGIALVLMVLNHAALYLLPPSLDPARHILVYLTVSLAAPLFLLLVGFSLALSFYGRNNVPRNFDIRVYWRYLKRGAGLAVAGYLLNIVLVPHEPIYSGGILQTIGLSIIIIAPGLHWLQRRMVPDLLLLLALVLYLLFVYAQPGLGTWLAQHNEISHIFFEGFPPWPWVSLILVGVILGYKWIETDLQQEKIKTYMNNIKAIAIGCLAIYFMINLYHGRVVNFTLQHDYIINGHWLPNSTTLFWILGMSLLCIVLIRHIEAIQYRYLRLFIVLGQSAFVLYVVHLLVIAGIADRLLGVNIEQWWLFIVFNLVLVAGLLLVANWWRPQQLAMPVRTG